jgi:hypothetical protein
MSNIQNILWYVYNTLTLSIHNLNGFYSLFKNFILNALAAGAWRAPRTRGWKVQEVFNK